MHQNRSKGMNVFTLRALLVLSGWFCIGIAHAATSTKEVTFCLHIYKWRAAMFPSSPPNPSNEDNRQKYNFIKML